MAYSTTALNFHPQLIRPSCSADSGGRYCHALVERMGSNGDSLGCLRHRQPTGRSRPESTFGDTISGGSAAAFNPGGATAGVGASYLHVEAGPEDDSTGSTGCASLSGTVTTPGQTDPLYNAVVYVARGNVDAIASGASCDRCGGLSAAKAVTATLTGPDGKFKLTGVPLGDAVPLVIQLGKWRRVVSVKVTGCARCAGAR